jgi:hypothetical protein
MFSPEARPSTLLPLSLLLAYKHFSNNCVVTEVFKHASHTSASSIFSTFNLYLAFHPSDSFYDSFPTENRLLPREVPRRSIDPQLFSSICPTIIVSGLFPGDRSSSIRSPRAWIQRANSPLVKEGFYQSVARQLAFPITGGGLASP